MSLCLYVLKISRNFQLHTKRKGGLGEVAQLPYTYPSPVQNEIKRLYNQLVKKKAALQQSLNEISGQSIGKQLQVNHQNVHVNLTSEQRVLAISCMFKTHTPQQVSVTCSGRSDVDL